MAELSARELVHRPTFSAVGQGRWRQAAAILAAGTAAAVGIVALRRGSLRLRAAAAAAPVGLEEQVCVPLMGICSEEAVCCGSSKCYSKNEFEAYCLNKCHHVDKTGAGWSCNLLESGSHEHHLQATAYRAMLRELGRWKKVSLGKDAAQDESSGVVLTPPVAIEPWQLKTDPMLEVLSTQTKTTTATTVTTTTKAGCAADGKDCRGYARCCNAVSTCYVKNDYWASCNATCDSKHNQEGDDWNCAVVFKNEPPQSTTPSPQAECSWEGEDCTSTKCCRRTGFKCFEQMEDVWASCSDKCSKLTAMADPDTTWTCKVLGGDQRDIVVPSASGSDVAGVGMFCFTVVTPEGVVSPGVKANYESELLDLFKSKKVGLYACEDWAVYQGHRVSTGSWQSVQNTEIFSKVWRQVKVEQTYKRREWTVKVDADAVFFPERLKAHIRVLQPPKDTPVYFRNIDFKFKFQGALEVLSQQAVDIFLTSMDECDKHLGHDGGEDLFTKSCLDASRVGYMEDFKLLDDKYTHPKGWNLFDVDSCIDQSFVALHPYKAVSSWWGCYEVAMKVKKTSDFVSCDARWPGDACSLSSTKVH